MADLAFAVSVTYTKQEKAANPGSTPVSATKSFIIIGLQNRRMDAKSKNLKGVEQYLIEMTRIR